MCPVELAREKYKTVMNVTYVIGNGFDIALGLRTSYQDFLNCYLCEERSSSLSVKVLKAMIKSDRETWGDAEKALGEIDFDVFGRKTDIGMVGGVVSAYDDMRYKLREYIRECQSCFPKVIDSYINKRFRTSLLSIHTGLCDVREKNNFYRDARRVDFNFINFNYTRTLMCLLGDIIERDATELFVRSLCVKDRHITTYFHEPLHVHGRLLDDSRGQMEQLAFGVGRKDQIVGCEKGSIEYEQLNAVLNKDDDGKYQRKDANVSNVVETLDNSDVIILFGVSIGITDCFWWDRIFKWLLKSSSNRLIYSPYYDLSYGEIQSNSYYEESEINSVVKKMTAHIKGCDVVKAVSRVRNQILILTQGPHYDCDGESARCDPLHLQWVKRHLHD